MPRLPKKTTKGKLRKNKTGRRPTYDPIALDAILPHIRNGLPEEQSCHLAGINYTTFRGWKRAFPQIATEIQKARAQALAERIVIIKDAAAGGSEYETQEIITKAKDGSITKKLIRKKTKPDWYAAAWWASRQYVDQFGSDRAALEKTLKQLLRQGQAQAEQRKPTAGDGSGNGDRGDGDRG